MRLYEIANLKTLQDFRDTKMGLLTPNGDLISVEQYGHFEELSKYPEFKDDIELFKQKINDAMHDFEMSNMDTDNDYDDHIEWHVFEIYRDEEEATLRQEILQKAYNLGWGRLGLMYRRPKPHLIELETSSKNISKLKKYAMDIAEMLDAELFIHKVDNFKK